MWRGDIGRYFRPHDLSGEVLAAQIGLLAQTSIIDVLVFAAGAALVGLGFATSGTASYATVIAWELLFAALGAAGIFLSWRYRHAVAASADESPPPDISRWEVWFVIHSACICMAWSSLVILFWADPSDIEILMLFGAAMLGNVAVLTNFLPLRSAMIAAVLGINLPVLARLIMATDGYLLASDGYLLASIVLLVALVVDRAGSNANATLTGWLTLRLKNRELVSQLRISLMEAEYANNAKSQFLGNISHQLRTPLNAIIGFAEIMQQKLHGELGDPRYAEYVDDVANSSNSLLAMINDILDLSKLDVGGSDLVDDEFDLAGEIESAVSMVMGTAVAHKVTIVVQPSAPCRITADRVRFKQILINLLSNAIKFSAPGQTVHVGWCAGAADGLEISVCDAGVGMLPAEAKRVLEPFENIDGSNGDNNAAGLGLPLSKVFAELHGGSLQLVSKPGEGTTAIIGWPSDRIWFTEHAPVAVASAACPVSR